MTISLGQYNLKYAGEGQDLVTDKKSLSDQSAVVTYGGEFERISKFLRSAAGCRRDDVEDVARGTFLRLIEADQLELIRDPERHLFSMAYEALQAQEERQCQSDDTSKPAGTLEAQDAIAASEMKIDVDRGRLLAALDALPDSLQLPLILSTLGMTHSQIASSLGLSVNATLTKLVRARAQLMLDIKKVDV